MNRLTVALAAAAALAFPAVSQAAPCRDAQGHFVKCAAATPLKAPAKTLVKTPARAVALPQTAAKPAAAVRRKAATNTHKAAAATPRCRNAKGQFAKCGTAGARPM